MPSLLLLVFAFALVIRLAFNVLIHPTFQSDFFRIAHNILTLKTYTLDGIHPTMYRTPLYPLIIAFISFCFGAEPIVFVIFTAIIGAGNALLCAWISYKLFGRKAALIAGILYAIIPYLAWQEVASESGLATLWVLAAIVLLWKAWETPDKRQLIIYAGVLSGCAYLTRPTVALVPLFISVFMMTTACINKKLARIHMIHTLLFFCIFMLCVTPWIVYNKRSFKHYAAGQIAFWETVYAGNHPHAFAIYPQYSFDNLFPLAAPQMWPHEKNDYEQTQAFKKIALHELREIGVRKVALNSVTKFAYLWSPRLTPYHKRIGTDSNTRQPLDSHRTLLENLAFSVPYVFLRLCASRGGWLERKRRWLILLTCGIILCFSLPYMITTVCSRYAVPAYFLLVIWASRGIQEVRPK